MTNEEFGVYLQIK